MGSVDLLIRNNREWSERIGRERPGFFDALSAQQAPQYLWIGCSDSRVPANEVVGLLPGELFVHRNIANLVVHSDLNCLSVLQYAVDVLGVRHVIVCGHYGCSGVRASLEARRHGLVDNWLRHIQDTQARHAAALADLAPSLCVDRLCELNVLDQVLNVGRTTILGDAWSRGQRVAVHAWIYGLDNGRVRDLACTLDGSRDPMDVYRQALAAVLATPPHSPA